MEKHEIKTAIGNVAKFSEIISRLAKDYAALIPGTRRAYLKDWYISNDKLHIHCEIWEGGSRRQRHWSLPAALLYDAEPERSLRLIKLAEAERNEDCEARSLRRHARIASLEAEIARLKLDERKEAEFLTTSLLDEKKRELLATEALFSPNKVFKHIQTTAFICAEALRSGKPQLAAICHLHRLYYIEITPDDARATAERWLAHREIDCGRGYRALTEYLRKEGHDAQELVAKEKRTFIAALNNPNVFAGKNAYNKALTRAMIIHDEQRLIREWFKIASS